MPLVEIDEAELVVHKTARALVEKLGGNPKTRAKLLGLIKEVNPAAVIPELDAAAPVMTALAERDTKIAALEKTINDDREERTKRRSQRELEAQVSGGRKKLADAGYTDEGITAIEKLMTERGVTDYEAAAALFDKTQPAESPVAPYGGNRWDFAHPADTDTEQKNWLADPVGQSQREIKNFLAENRSPIRARR